MIINNTIINKVISISYGGDGIIKEEGITGFVGNAILGEVVKSRVSEIKHNYFRSELIEVLEPSPFRIQPLCRYFGKCGGCVYQHIDYGKHPEIKTAQLKELLNKIGKIDYAKNVNFITSPKAYSYRNQLTVKTKTIRGNFETGFIGFDNKTFVPIDKCLLAKDSINNTIADIKKELAKSVKIKKLEGEITIKSSKDDKIDFAFLESIHPKGNYKPLYETIEDKTYYFSLSTFFQTNPYILPALMSELKNILNFESSETLFDLYCGTGLFSIYFSSFVKSVCGIELNPSGIRLAQKTAEINNIKNCKFFEGNVSESFVEIFNRYKTGRDIIMLDPPRAGLSKEMTKFLTETKINKLAYVSCEPSRLSRDLNILCNNGYHITDIFIADMFPQTMHMETIAVLSNNH